MCDTDPMQVIEDAMADLIEKYDLEGRVRIHDQNMMWFCRNTGRENQYDIYIGWNEAGGEITGFYFDITDNVAETIRSGEFSTMQNLVEDQGTGLLAAMLDVEAVLCDH